MADLNQLERTFSHIQCTHQGCSAEPCIFVYSKLSKRITPHCLQHAQELLRRGAYVDLDEQLFDSPEERV